MIAESTRWLTKPKTFWTQIVLTADSAQEWTQQTAGNDLDHMVECWLTEMDVRPIYISPPSMQLIGRDAEQKVHLIAGVSLLYVSQEEVAEDDDAAQSGTDAGTDAGTEPLDLSSLGPLGELLGKLQAKLPRGVKLADVIKVPVSGNSFPPGEGPT